MTWSSAQEGVLLDTHALIWTSEGADFPGYKLSQTAIDTIGGAMTAFVSYASLWEMAIKTGQIGPRSLKLSLSFDDWIDRLTDQGTYEMLDIRNEHLKRVSTLPSHHGDPFDRLLVAQSLVEGLPIVSADETLDVYGVQRIW